MSSRKYAALSANPWAAFVIGDQKVPQTLQIEGPVVELKGSDEMGKHLPELVQRLTSNATYFAPITKMNPSSIVVMWLQGKWIRWADYASPESGSEHVLTQLDPKESFVD